MTTARGPSGALARPDWWAGSELSASDLRLEQKYFLQRLRRDRRLVHGWGVVCGLNVVSANDTSLNRGWELLVCPGYGVGPCGDEILVETPFPFGGASTNSRLGWGNRAWIAVESGPDPAAYEPSPPEPGGCGCGGAPEQISRFTDGLRIVVTWTPSFTSGRGFDVCRGGNPPCPECPPSCALPLAVVTLPSLNEPILNPSIESFGGH